MKTLLIICLIIGIVVIGFIAIVYYNNRNAKPRIHPDPKNPNIWYDDEMNEYLI